VSIDVHEERCAKHLGDAECLSYCENGFLFRKNNFERVYGRLERVEEVGYGGRNVQPTPYHVIIH